MAPGAAALETERLVLRAPQLSDLDAVHALLADPVANRFSPSGLVSSREASGALLQIWLDHWQARGFGYWAVSWRESPEKLLGFGGVMSRGSAGLFLYFRIEPKSWGQGLASELALAALDVAFNRLHEHSVQAVVLPNNTTSRKTLERIGMLPKSAVADVPGQAPSIVYEMTAARFAELPKMPREPTPFGA